MFSKTEKASVIMIGTCPLSWLHALTLLPPLGEVFKLKGIQLENMCLI